MFYNILLIICGGLYGIITAVIAIFFAGSVFRFIDKHANRFSCIYTIKMLSMLIYVTLFLGVIVVFGEISWYFPINDKLRTFFSSFGLLAIWFTLLFYFKKN